MKAITISISLLTLLIGLTTFAGTPIEWGKWKKGELLLENHSFEEDQAAWGLEDGACCGRGGLYTYEARSLDRAFFMCIEVSHSKLWHYRAVNRLSVYNKRTFQHLIGFLGF